MAKQVDSCAVRSAREVRVGHPGIRQLNERRGVSQQSRDSRWWRKFQHKLTRTLHKRNRELPNLCDKRFLFQHLHSSLLHVRRRYEFRDKSCSNGQLVRCVASDVRKVRKVRDGIRTARFDGVSSNFQPRRVKREKGEPTAEQCAFSSFKGPAHEHFGSMQRTLIPPDTI